MRVFLAGAAGLVGQNLITLLKADPSVSILAIDRHLGNVRTLRDLHPNVEVIEADLAERGAWCEEASRCDVAVVLQAQIGGLNPNEFERNNIVATNRILEAFGDGANKYICHISSSVVNSKAIDLYTESKKQQEKIIVASSVPHVILRPTLMFGWFDRKHLGWLRRFMDRSAIFPIPGHGRYPRQPLYAGDFSAIIEASIKSRITGSYNISGLEKIDYIDLIRAIKDVAKARAAIVKIPYGLFWALLAARAAFDSDPPFTTKQLEALVIPETFEVIDWPAIFGVKPTPLREALDLTFNHPVYSKITLSF